MFGHWLYLLLQAFSIGAAAFAFWKGGRAERVAAGVIVLNVLIGYVLVQALHQRGGLSHLANDGFAALALLMITLRFGAPWMGGAMLFYAAQFTLHSYALVTGQTSASYWFVVLNNVNWNGVVWCLIIGTAMSWRARARQAAPMALAT